MPNVNITLALDCRKISLTPKVLNENKSSMFSHFMKTMFSGYIRNCNIIEIFYIAANIHCIRIPNAIECSRRISSENTKKI